MPIDRSFVGRSFPASALYEVAREKIRDFALAVSETSPLCLDPVAARAAGHPDVVAPPTFLTVLTFRFAADGPLGDPALGLDYSRVVHGEQHFALHRPVHAGDRLATTSTIEAIRDAGGNELMTVRSEVEAEDGAPVATLFSTLVSRGTAAAREV